MKTFGKLIAMGLCLFILASCNSNNSGTDVNNPPDTTGTADRDTTPEQDPDILSIGTECGSLAPGQFCANGLEILQLGDSLTWNNNVKPAIPGVTMKDTIFEDGEGEEAASWFVKILEHKDGRVYLEADFDTGHLLNRVRIETADYAHVSGLKVGSTVSDILAQFPEPFIGAFEQYDVMEIIVPYAEGRKMVFHIPLGDWYDSSTTEWKAEDLPASERVSRIVLM